MKKIKCPCCGKKVYKIIDGGILQHLDDLTKSKVGYVNVHTCETNKQIEKSINWLSEVKILIKQFKSEYKSNPIKVYMTKDVYKTFNKFLNVNTRWSIVKKGKKNKNFLSLKVKIGKDKRSIMGVENDKDRLFKIYNLR